MKITVNWTFGNFSVTAATDIPFTEPVDALTKAIVTKGFLQLLQRVPASNAEKALAGYEKRPAGFKRDSIPYSEENALKLSEAFGTTVEVEEGVQLPFSITDVVEHDTTDKGTSKEATELWTTVQASKGEDFDNALANLGLDSETYDDAKGIAACRKFIQAAVILMVFSILRLDARL